VCGHCSLSPLAVPMLGNGVRRFRLGNSVRKLAVPEYGGAGPEAYKERGALIEKTLEQVNHCEIKFCGHPCDCHYVC